MTTEQDKNFAFLTSYDMSVEPISYDSIMNAYGDEISRIHGPMRYTYRLTYVSTGPIDITDFPDRINPRPEEPYVPPKKLEVKYVTNAISQLEVIDTSSDAS